MAAGCCWPPYAVTPGAVPNACEQMSPSLNPTTTTIVIVITITFPVGHQKWPWLASSTSRIKDATPGSNTCSNRILSAKSTRLHSQASRRAPRPAGRPRCVPSFHFPHQQAPARSTNSKTEKLHLGNQPNSHSRQLSDLIALMICVRIFGCRCSMPGG